MVYSCFHATKAQPSSCNRDVEPQNLNYLPPGPVQQKLAERSYTILNKKISKDLERRQHLSVELRKARE